MYTYVQTHIILVKKKKKIFYTISCDRRSIHLCYRKWCHQ